MSSRLVSIGLGLLLFGASVGCSPRQSADGGASLDAAHDAGAGDAPALDASADVTMPALDAAIDIGVDSSSAELDAATSDAAVSDAAVSDAAVSDAAAAPDAAVTIDAATIDACNPVMQATACGAQCSGTAPNGCGGTFACSAPCASPETCGGGATPDQCGCTPDPDPCPANQCAGTASNGCGGTVACAASCGFAGFCACAGGHCGGTVCVCDPPPCI